ncbi:MAG: hypothetical protein Q9192_002962 [Flavoplaca navasiana]
MGLLENHLEQISLSAAAIAELPFPSPKKYTNALLRPHDITALIRDTEPHERVLFSFTAPGSAPPQTHGIRPRRNTVYDLTRESQHSSSLDVPWPPRPRSVVTTLLGSGFEEQVRSRGEQPGKERGEVDIDVLLKGADKLCAIYPMPGARERISSLRSRFNQLTASVTKFEARVTKQSAQLAKRNRQGDTNDNRDNTSVKDSADLESNEERANDVPITADDLEKEEQEIRELERRKRALEDRVSGMERDLGGLLR